MRPAADAAPVLPLARTTAPALLVALLAGAPLRAQTPERVVSLHPAATEILLALGAGELLVARMAADVNPGRDGRAGIEPDPLGELPSVGEMLTPNLEVLASVEPDLVIAWAGADLGALSRVVGRRGGRVETIAVDRMHDVLPAIEEIGGWVGREGAARRLAEELAATLGEARSLARSGPRPRLLWIVSSEPIVIAGPGTFIHDVIEIGGGENAGASAGAPWPRLGLESIVALDPDVLVWPEGPGLFGADALVERPGWSSLRAVEEGRVLVVDAERYHDAGPEIARASLELARDLKRLVGR